ncbi:hypothetical protein PP175_07410 [Aneurinibacillus sp. Ricciae_BoGa-3]|uniref:hypothetical protein n=1 Tax=Aneurinibacillus sp. Ricciae_BoGa-3 TaxID=3022697 RepID=UPI0023416528|nr:hypothetical protein [Aneurinibacillus sp. Ricciae_BoGa-3]WCK55759.1 hypothetical protein PP175_07410 [Aneurinibacillus sp. Ricciae_BoGa-3]
MEKRCMKCQALMELKLRRVVYMNHMEIDHVPIYSCSQCENNQLVEYVKEDLKKLLHEIGQMHTFEGCISFACHSPFSDLLLRLSQQSYASIDDLLDLYLLALSLKDRMWVAEIERELAERVNCK